jgi:hypothetical protein
MSVSKRRSDTHIGSVDRIGLSPTGCKGAETESGKKGVLGQLAHRERKLERGNETLIR